MDYQVAKRVRGKHMNSCRWGDQNSNQARKRRKVRNINNIWLRKPLLGLTN